LKALPSDAKCSPFLAQGHVTADRSFRPLGADAQLPPATVGTGIARQDQAAMILVSSRYVDDIDKRIVSPFNKASA
jgi:hypothetical protein